MLPYHLQIIFSRVLRTELCDLMARGVSPYLAYGVQRNTAKGDYSCNGWFLYYSSIHFENLTQTDTK